MPIEQYLLDYANIVEEPAPIGDSMVEYARKSLSIDEERKKYLRDRFLDGLSSDFDGVRHKFVSDISKEIEDPHERQFLINEVIKRKKAMEWIDRYKYNKAGFGGRFVKNLGDVGKAFINANIGISEAATDVAKYSVGLTPSKENLEFRNGIESANSANDFQLEGFRKWTKIGAEGIAQFAPDMEASILAGAGAGPYGMFSYWTARLAPEQTRKYMSMGADPLFASLAGYTTSAASSAIELFNYDPTGGLMVGGSGLLNQAVKTATNISKEAIEEPWQAATESGMQYLVGKSFPGLKGPEFMDVARAPGIAVQQSLPSLIGIGLASGGGKNIRIMQNEAIERQIIKSANEGSEISRKQWTGWGLPSVEKTSQEQRKEYIAAIAERIKTRDQFHALVNRKHPTMEQWKEWGFPEELGKTGEVRLHELDAMVLGGAALEAREIAPDSVRQAFDQIAAIEASTGGAADTARVRSFTPEGEVDTNRVINVEDDGNFIEDIKGSIGIRVNPIVKKFKNIAKVSKYLMKKFWTSKGELTQEAFDTKIEKEARLARNQNMVNFAIADFNKAMRSVYGTTVLDNDTRDLLRDYLRGQVHWSDIPPELKTPLNNMRDQIDALSRTAIEIGVAQGELAVIIDENQGVYLTRGYRKFNEAGYDLKVPDDIRNKVTAMLREQYPSKSESQIQGLIAALLYEKSPDHVGVFNPISKGTMLSKDLSVLKKRVLDEMPEIRALYGEYEDPRIEYARTVQKLGGLVAQHKFLADLRESGLRQGFFSDPENGPTINQFGELKHQIAVDQNKSLYPLNGMWTTPEIYDALIEQSGNVPNWLRVYMMANSIVKTGKTILSPMTHVRNLVGNVGFTIQNAHWRIGKFGTAWETVKNDLIKTSDKDFQAKILRYIDLKVLGEEVHANELKDYIRDYDKYNSFDDFVNDAETRRSNKTKLLYKKTLRGIVKLYALEDAFWKIYAFENEKTRYRKAIPELSELSDEDLDRKVARIIRNTYPTYSLVPRAMKGLRHIPVVGTFVSFPSEIVRTTYHSMKLSMDEMSDPRLRKIGAQRFAGNLLMLTGSGALGTMCMLLSGITRKEDEAMRDFLPYWQKNSQFIHFGRNKNGDFRIIDLGYSDPHNFLKNPIKAFLSGNDLKESLWRGTSEAAEPFLGLEILYKAINKAALNSDGRVRNPEDEIDRQAYDTLKYLWDEAFKPGAISSIERIAKGVSGKKSTSGFAYNPAVETTAMLTGQRIQDIDIHQSLTYRIKEFKSRKRLSGDMLGRVIKNRGSVSQNEIIEAYNRSEDSRKNLYEEFFQVIRNAKLLGLDVGEIYSIFDSENLTKDDRYSIYNKSYFPKKFSKAYYEAVYNANPNEYNDRITALRRAIQVRAAGG